MVFPLLLRGHHLLHIVVLRIARADKRLLERVHQLVRIALLELFEALAVRPDLLGIVVVNLGRHVGESIILRSVVVEVSLRPEPVLVRTSRDLAAAVEHLGRLWQKSHCAAEE